MNENIRLVLALLIATAAVYYLGFWITLGILVIAGIITQILE